MSYPTSTASQYSDGRVLTLKRALAALNEANGVTVSANYPYTSAGQYSDGEALTLKRLNLALSGISGVTPESYADLDLSDLPTSDPGGGKPWLNGGVQQVGP